MKRKRIKLLSLLFIVVFSLNIFTGCQGTDKEIIISEDVKEEIQLEENQVEALLREGQEYLKENKFQEARSSFEEAVNKSISDKEIYLRIKDKYSEVNRYDDAYYFVNLAIKNNVDTENMNSLLIEIRDKMDTVAITCDAYVNQVGYTLPEKVMVNIDEKEYEDSVVWSDFNNEIGEPKTYTYHGITKEYGRNVVATLNVADFNKNTIGFVRDTYIENNQIFIVYDEAEFYTGEEALKEAKKDGVDLPKFDDGEEYIPNGYYLRNKVEDTIILKVADHAIIKIPAFLVTPNDETTLPMVTDYETFKAHVDENKDVEYAERALLFKTNIKHGVVEELEMQFTP